MGVHKYNTPPGKNAPSRFHGAQNFSPPFRPQNAALQEDRHITADFRTQPYQFGVIKSGVPQRVQGFKHRGGVRTASAQPSPRGYGLFQPDTCAFCAPGVLLETDGGAGGEVPGRRRQAAENIFALHTDRVGVYFSVRRFYFQRVEQ
ncbi:MAG: hypothetical protein R6V03_07020 [Kiritimatiellia bacterium]